MKFNYVTCILIFFPLLIFAQNYEQRGDSLFAIGQYEKAIKQYNAAIEVVGESSLFKRYELKEKISKADNLQQQSTLRYLNLNMIGTIGTSRGTLVYKEKSDNGYYTYQLSKTTVKRTIPEGALPGEFSVSPTKKVRFSKGNLQYNAALGSHQCADGTTQQGTWRFAENQYDYVGDASLGNVYENGAKCNNALISTTYSGWVDLFGYSTSKTYYGVSSSTSNANYSGTFVDWGLTMGETWRTLTKTEWEYLINGRANHTSLLFFVCVEGVKGMLLLPDDYLFDSENTISNKKQYSQQEFSKLENKGAVFLPANGYRDGTQLATLQTVGEYYANTDHLNNLVDGLQFYYSSNYVYTDNNNNRYDGRGVRLVQDIE